MNDTQTSSIIEDVMKAHWPNWEFKGQELFVWMQELRKFDYNTTKNAINELYKSWTKDRYPKMPHILASIRNLSNQNRQMNKRLASLFVIAKQDGVRRWWPFVGDVNTPKEEIQKRAEQLREEANRLYLGEHHIVHYLSTDDPDSQEDKGYYGPGARQKAIDEILAGPDTKTKRWLIANICKDKKSKPKQKQETVPIGQVVDDIPF